MTGARPSLGQTAIVLSAFAVLFVFAVFWPLATENLVLKRAHATAWAAALLATPAMYKFARAFGREPLDNWWRLFWTFGWIMAMIHFYFGLFGLHHGDPMSVFERQGALLAGTIFALVLLWGWDVADCWLRRDWREDDILSRRLAFWVAVVAFLLSTILFNNAVQSLTVGLLMAAALLLGTLQRIDALGSWRAFFDSPLPPIILGAILIAAALFGPSMLSTASPDATEIALIQSKWTVWPAILLGGVAAALFVARWPLDQEDWGWSGWWIMGALAFLAHVYASFWLYFGGSFSDMFAAQGWLVAGSNWLLTGLWTASAGVAWAGWRAAPLHAAATGLFIVSTALATYDRPGNVQLLGLGLVAIWAIVGGYRFFKRGV